jgi:hypothetical protein
MVSRLKYTGDVFAIYMEFAVIRPCFQDHWKSHLVSILQRTLPLIVEVQMCGRVNTKARRSQPRRLEYFQEVTPRRSRE